MRPKIDQMEKDEKRTAKKRGTIIERHRKKAENTANQEEYINNRSVTGYRNDN